MVNNQEINKSDNIDENEGNHDESYQDVNKYEEEIELLKQEISNLKDQMIRSIADMDNMKKRYEKQIDDIGKFAISNFAKDLLSVMDNMRRALDTIMPEHLENHEIIKNIHTGIDMTKNELSNVFDKHGIQEISPIAGSDFDHNFHQAVAHNESDDVNAGQIINVMQSGYSLKNRLLRPAMVIVAK